MSVYLLIRICYIPGVTTLFLLTGLGFVLFVTGACLLTWAVRSGQWDDLDTPAQRMLGDDPPAKRK